jgi:hypothetical protein
MKIIRRLITLSLIGILITSGSFATHRIFAVEVTGSNITASTCQSAQSTLSAVQKADTVIRVNLGHNYDEMLNLMFAGTARLASNKIPAPTLSETAANFSTTLDNFKRHFDEYDDAIAATISADCINNPTNFLNKLSIARAARTTLNDDVVNLNRFIENYNIAWQDAVKDLP